MSLDRSSPIPFYTQLKEVLENAISDGVYAPGDPIPTELELCRRYNLSRHTVRQAIAGLVHEGIVYRVPGKGSFVARQRPKANLGTGAVSFLMAGVTDFFALRLLKGVEEVTTEERFTLTFGNCKADLEQQTRLIEEAIDAGTEGFVIMPVDPPREPFDTRHLKPMAFLKQLGIPVVFVDRYYDGVDMDAIVSDNFRGMVEAVNHLVRLGHRKIGFISTDNFQTTSVADRYKGYLFGLEQGGIRPIPSWVFGRHNTGEVQGIRTYLREIRPSAVIALNDFIAAEVLLAAKEEGMKVPEHLSLIGFDNSEIASLVEVPLTTVAQPAEQLGQRAARRLIELLRGKGQNEPNPKIERVPTQLIVRESTGSPF